MSESNFEKKLQLEMLDFKVKPSNEVWLKVEDRIRKKKRRRFIFILFFSSLALVGYWQRDLLFNEKNLSVSKFESAQQTIISDEESIKSNVSEKINTDKIVIKDSAVKKNDLVKTETLSVSETKKNIPVNEEKQRVKSSEIVAVKAIKEKDKLAAEKKIPDSDNSGKVLQAEELTVVPPGVENKSSAEKEVLPITDMIVSEKSSDSVFAEKLNESIGDYKTQNDSIKKPEIVTDSMVPLKKKPAIVKKWKLGVQVTPGISSFADQFILGSSTKSADFLNSPSAGGSPPPTPPAQPSGRKSGFALQLGGFVQRKISSKTQISIGLQYGYYSDHILIGNNRDSILRNNPQSASFRDASQVYAAANSSRNYSNKYHFIELPVEMNFQINKKSTKPVFFNIGFKAGRLISTNALVYDTAFGGIYFDAKKQLNKTQFSFSTGFSWTIPAKQFEWNVGPVFDFHINRFMNNSFEADKYLIMPGIRTKIIFPGKK